MRKCNGQYVRYNEKDMVHEIVPFEDGAFHQWGIDSEEYENGAVNFTVGIVELPNGQVIMPLARWIQFVPGERYE